MTALVLALALALGAPAAAAPPPPKPTGCLIKSPPRSERAKREFRREMPCPATGKFTGPCKGWEIDHTVPLCCGGPDHWRNMRWLSHRLHKIRHGHCRDRSCIDCAGLTPWKPES